MTSLQYQAAVKKLGHTPYSVAAVLGISIRQSHRYASGEQTVAEPVAKLIRCYLVHGLPENC